MQLLKKNIKLKTLSLKNHNKNTSNLGHMSYTYDLRIQKKKFSMKQVIMKGNIKISELNI